MRQTTSKTFKTAYPRSIPLTEWTNKTNRCFAHSNLNKSAITTEVVGILSVAGGPLTVKAIEKKVYGRRLRTMNQSTHVRRVVKKLIWDYPSLFTVTRENGFLELVWK
jgi:hypothetical protein